MFCPNCGAQVPDGNTFCTNCGFRLADPAAPVNPVNPAGEYPADMPAMDPAAGPAPAPFMGGPDQAVMGGPQPEAKPKKKIPWLWIIIGGAVLLIAAVVLIILLTRPKKIELEDMVEVNFTGYNGYGEAHARLNDEALEMRFLDAYGVNLNSLSGLDSYALMLQGVPVTEAAAAYDTIKLTVTPQTGLSNGDTVTVAITYDNEVAKKADLKFVGEEVTATVSGLQDVEEIDPFDGLEVSFSGQSGDGRCSIEYNGSSWHISTYDFDVEPYNGLSNGDTVTITYSYDDEYTLEEGFITTNKSMTVTVSGLAEHISGFASIPADFLDELKEDAQAYIREYTSDSWGEETTIGELTYEGYVMAVEDTDSAYDDNILYLIYSAQATNSENEFDPTTVYFPVYYEDLETLTGENGPENQYYYRSYYCGYEYFNDGYVNTNGYVNPYQAYAEIMEEETGDDIVIEVGDGFESFASFTPITKLSEVPEGVRDYAKSKAEEIINAYFGEDYDPEEVTVANLTYVGDIFYVNIDEAHDYVNNNIYCVVYSATVTSMEDEPEFEPTTMYYPVIFGGIYNLPDGGFFVMRFGDILNSGYIMDSWVWSKGFDNGIELYDYMVTSVADSAEIDVSPAVEALNVPETSDETSPNSENPEETTEETTE